jgi:hypothetical protein
MTRIKIAKEMASAWRLRADLLSAKSLLWIAGAGRSGDPRPEVHLYFYDRYWRLAVVMEQKGRTSRAALYRAKAVEHYRLSGHDGPPFAAALALPRPGLFPRTHVGQHSAGSGDDDAA